MISNESLNRNQKIYITEYNRENLFKHIKEVQDEMDIDYFFSAENLERYCSGKTNLGEYAYGHIRKLLKKEYKEWLIEADNKKLKAVPRRIAVTFEQIKQFDASLDKNTVNKTDK